MGGGGVISLHKILVTMKSNENGLCLNKTTEC